NSAARRRRAGGSGTRRGSGAADRPRPAREPARRGRSSSYLQDRLRRLGARRMHVPAVAARALLERAVESLEHRREIALDVLQLEELLVQPVVAALAVPQQAVALVRQAHALD